MQTIIIAGNVGKDAETRQTNSGSVTGFNVAVNNGRGAESTWYKCSLWGARGEKLAGYLTKGSKVTVSGRLTAGLYEGKLDLKIDVADVALQGDKQDRAEPRQQSRAASGGGGYSDDLNDDVPFISGSPFIREPGASKRSF
jgi:single-strand DNA-binding protein